MADNVAITAGTGTTVATDEVGGVHYQRVKVAHGGDGAATDVSTASPLPVGGAAADDAAAAGNPLSVGGVYQATVDEVDDGDVGRVRMTARRVLKNAADSRSIQLTASAPAPAGTDITTLGATVLTSDDFAIRDTNAHTFLIPIGLAGWRNVIIRFGTSGDAALFDQALTFSMWGFNITGGLWHAKLLTVTVPTLELTFAIGNGAIGVGAGTGGETASDGVFYNVPALAAGWDSIFLYISASVAPSAGDFFLTVTRST